MPIKPTYPGVYIQEIPSGVRTITGVATSITAFLGKAVRGPVNKAVHILSLKDYERNFGGLSADSDMSYAVHQFFLNGGSEAWVVRLAKDPLPAELILKDGTDNTAKKVLKITALDEGDAGNHIEVEVDYNTIDPANTFNLTFIYVSQDNPADSRTETFKNLSMKNQDFNFVEAMINDVSQLVTVQEIIDDTHAPVAPGNPTVPVPTGPNALTTGVPKRPAELGLAAGSLTNKESFTEEELKTLPDLAHNGFMIGFNGHDPLLVTIDSSRAAVGNDVDARLSDIASRIQKAVQSRKLDSPAWRHFTCTVQDKKLVLTSGTPGKDSSVTVTDVPDAAQHSIFKELRLNNVTPTAGRNSTSLENGQAKDFKLVEDEAFGVFFGDRLKREGIFALDEVDLFNLLCLPGETNPGILAEAIAYCQERRAFLIVDSPKGLTPAQMVNFITGPKLPKGEFGQYAAIYYPWIKAPDPLNNGKLRSFSPSGTIAGLYARTDSTRGVWKAPAGTEATLVGVQAMDYLLTDNENGTLNPHGVNCLRIFPVYGAVCWGARTVSGDDELASEYKYVPIRRLALYIEESLYRGTKWVVFEPNDEPLWAQIRLNVGAFMHNLFVKGAFQGRTPKEAYFVKCDKETTTQNDIDLGIVNILVGFAPLKPAEFVIISLQQIAGQLQV